MLTRIQEYLTEESVSRTAVFCCVWVILFKEEIILLFLRLALIRNPWVHSTVLQFKFLKPLGIIRNSFYYTETI